MENMEDELDAAWRSFRGPVPQPKCDVVFVDEVQDLAPLLLHEVL